MSYKKQAVLGGCPRCNREYVNLLEHITRVHKDVVFTRAELSATSLMVCVCGRVVLNQKGLLSHQIRYKCEQATRQTPERKSRDTSHRHNPTGSRSSSLTTLSRSSVSSALSPVPDNFVQHLPSPRQQTPAAGSTVSSTLSPLPRDWTPRQQTPTGTLSTSTINNALAVLGIGNVGGLLGVEEEEEEEEEEQLEDRGQGVAGPSGTTHDKAVVDVRAGEEAVMGDVDMERGLDVDMDVDMDTGNVEEDGMGREEDGGDTIAVVLGDAGGGVGGDEGLGDGEVDDGEGESEISEGDGLGEESEDSGEEGVNPEAGPSTTRGVHQPVAGPSNSTGDDDGYVAPEDAVDEEDVDRRRRRGPIRGLMGRRRGVVEVSPLSTAVKAKLTFFRVRRKSRRNLNQHPPSWSNPSCPWVTDCSRRCWKGRDKRGMCLSLPLPALLMLTDGNLSSPLVNTSPSSPILWPLSNWSTVHHYGS